MERLVIETRKIFPKIIESPWVPDDSIYILNDLNLPDQRPYEWDGWTVEEKLRWAVDHGMAIVVKSLG